MNIYIFSAALTYYSAGVAVVLSVCCADLAEICLPSQVEQPDVERCVLFV